MITEQTERKMLQQGSSQYWRLPNGYLHSEASYTVTSLVKNSSFEATRKRDLGCDMEEEKKGNYQYFRFGSFELIKPHSLHPKNISKIKLHQVCLLLPLERVDQQQHLDKLNISLCKGVI